MKKRVWTLCLLACFLLVTALSGCNAENGETGESGGDQSADSAAQVEENLLLYLPFDEGAGTAITDASGNLPEGELSYAYTNALYMDSQDPQWRTDGVSGGSLLFDGNSTCISYSKNDIQVEGSVFSVSVWFAPPHLRVGRPLRRGERHPGADGHRLPVLQGQLHRIPAGLPAVRQAVLRGGHRGGVADPLGGRQPGKV